MINALEAFFFKTGIGIGHIFIINIKYRYN